MFVSELPDGLPCSGREKLIPSCQDEKTMHIDLKLREDDTASEDDNLFKEFLAVNCRSHSPIDVAGDSVTDDATNPTNTAGVEMAPKVLPFRIYRRETSTAEGESDEAHTKGTREQGLPHDAQDMPGSQHPRMLLEQHHMERPPSSSEAHNVQNSQSGYSCGLAATTVTPPLQADRNDPDVSSHMQQATGPSVVFNNTHTLKGYHGSENCHGGLQDYHTQLQLLEEQNKIRNLLLAIQEKDSRFYPLPTPQSPQQTPQEPASYVPNLQQQMILNRILKAKLNNRERLMTQATPKQTNTDPKLLGLPLPSHPSRQQQLFQQQYNTQQQVQAQMQAQARAAHLEAQRRSGPTNFDQMAIQHVTPAMSNSADGNTCMPSMPHGPPSGIMAIQNLPQCQQKQPAIGQAHALQDYQMQMLLLEQQNKRRLLMARQEQDSVCASPFKPGDSCSTNQPEPIPQQCGSTEATKSQSSSSLHGPEMEDNCYESDDHTLDHESGPEMDIDEDRSPPPTPYKGDKDMIKRRETDHETSELMDIDECPSPPPSSQNAAKQELGQSAKPKPSIQPLPTLAQNRSKSDFFKHLGWSEDNPGHKRLYNLMKDEASEARKRLSGDRSNLNAEARDDSKVQPPYSSSHMTEMSLYNQVMTIWHSASPETKRVYDYGRAHAQGNVDNWIIRWVLWHVFRYRHTRNWGNNCRHARESSAGSAGSPPTSPTIGTSKPYRSSRGFYDPARDQAHGSLPYKPWRPDEKDDVADDQLRGEFQRSSGGH
ncbi:hypothetical protein NA57DRAFT_75018 [Rhizodiscina lignyota]|uniref:Uncharacterized protein n=1 Tax=Rhizodiscina lignyota TaxID=1504668 RepID=A0A9P4IHR0_9PEZI|nr:hypothetical protein NA57DRAFT_75018 [Rhizodiscina lignyota]